MTTVARRLLGFTTLPLLSLVIPLLALPIVARVDGAAGWAALAVGQAVGSYGAAVAYVGWNVLGTPTVATAREPEVRRDLYARSFYARLMALAVVIPVVATVAIVIVPGDEAHTAILFAVASALGALGVAWYGVGVSSPGLIAMFDLLPRLATTLITIPLVLLVRDGLPYAIGLIVAPILGLLAFHLRFFGRAVPRWCGFAVLRADIRRNRSAWAIEATGNLYSSAPVPFASVFGDSVGVAAYASGDRIYRYSLYAVVAGGNALQGWVLETDTSRARRNFVAIALMLGIGLLGGIAIAVFGVPATSLLFGRAVVATQLAMVYLAIAFFSVAASTPLIRNILIPGGLDRQVLNTTLCSAGVGLVVMALAASAWGASAVAIGLAVSETITGLDP
ncbi:polysaccharide biosynthesis protein [Microbacterium memoriense]|uniref:Polysaccharide biosynthesis protein n=1 Tax=Microbacterium memoriense TaxID=2978350 RepID=A0ABT2PEF2_9MICO|nr:hypothetical protein [Microbacterium memoriense]MCT9002975.1 hypothetical protein [Microbacterium memoriense]